MPEARELRVIQPPERVLSTLNADGSRRWIRPKPSAGRFARRRRVTAYALMCVFLVIPYLRMGGKPVILLDLPRREFTLFGTTFLPTETLLFMLLFVSAVLAILALTALFGRVWCGWACPQTVYMEFLFRPIERLFEGGWRGSTMIDKGKRPGHVRLLKHVVYAALAVFLAHTFLAYFVGVEALAQWVRRSPVEHPTSFLVMLGTTAAIFIDFAWFREQTCLVACPYGRLQSVILDRRSLIVGYDARRGEPRLKGVKDRPAAAGDCIDCRMCVKTCPTGIDIREGLQMECIHCTQCMDACDTVMAKIGKPLGLIRYGSRDRFEGRAGGLMRARVVAFGALLVVAAGVLAWRIGARVEAEVTVLRGAGAPYAVQADGRISNQVRVRVVNRGGAARRFAISIPGVPEAEVIAPVNPLPVEAGEVGATSLFVLLPPAAFEDGERRVVVRVDDGTRFASATPYRLLGPRDGAYVEGEPR